MFQNAKYKLQECNNSYDAQQLQIIGVISTTDRLGQVCIGKLELSLSSPNIKRFQEIILKTKSSSEEPATPGNVNDNQPTTETAVTDLIVPTILVPAQKRDISSLW